MKSYQLTSFQDILDQVPSDKIELCLSEIAKALADAKGVWELTEKTAISMAQAEGVDTSQWSSARLEIPGGSIEWIDDGKGEVGSTIQDEAGNDFLKLRRTGKEVPRE